MMKAFQKFLFFFFMLGLHAAVQAQSASQVIVANGGVFGSSNFVKMGAWNLVSGNYTVFDSFPASSVQHVRIHGRDAYVCADSFVVRYNLDNFSREAMAVIPGARQSAPWYDKLIVTRGFGSANGGAVVLNGSDLSVAFTLDSLEGNCEGLVVVGDSAYLANPFHFTHTTGELAVVDLRGERLHRLIDMDTMGRQIQNIYKDQNKLYSVNINRFNNPTFGFISEYDLPTKTMLHHKVDLPVSQGAGIFQGKLYANFNGNIGGWDLASKTLTDTVVVPGYWAGMTIDTSNARFYLTETDYFSYGKLYSFDLQGNKLDSVEVGISPEALAVDYNQVLAAGEILESQLDVAAFPVPFKDVLNLDLVEFAGKAIEVQLMDAMGQVLRKGHFPAGSIGQFSTEDLPAGCYWLVVSGSKGRITKAVSKQD